MISGEKFMKNSTKLALCIFVVLMLPILTICQNPAEIKIAKDEPPYKMVNLKFVLEGSPSPEDVGFNNPKSFWQFRYEFRFFGERLPFQSFKEKDGESQKERTKRIRKNNKIHDKDWKKYGVLITKGKVAKILILSAENREITIPVSLTPEITDFLAKAGNTLQNPYFRISLTEKVFIQTNAGLKFKRKITQAFVCPTKIQTKDAQYWSMNTCGISTEIRKMDDGRIVFGFFSRI
jgi:hypothetical protein